MPKPTIKEAVPGDLSGLFDDQPVQKQEGVTEPNPTQKAADDATPDDGKTPEPTDGVTKSDDADSVTYTAEQYEKATQKILKDGKVVEKEYYHVDGVFVGYVEDVQKSDTPDPTQPVTPIEAIQSLVSTVKKLTAVVEKHDKQLHDVATLAKTAKDTAERTVLVDARGLDDSVSALSKNDEPNQSKTNIWKGLVADFDALEQMRG